MFPLDHARTHRQTTRKHNAFSPIYYIYNFIRHLGSQKTLNNYTEKRRKTSKSVIHAFSQYSQKRRLNKTDRPVYLNSLQSSFPGAKYFGIKFCRLFSATCLTDYQLNNCIHSAQNILLKQLPTAKSRELM